MQYPENITRVQLSRLQQAYQRINTASTLEVDKFASQYPEYERLSWQDQEREARDLTQDPEANAPLLHAIAAKRGLDLPELVGRVLQKAFAYRHVVGNVIGQRQQLEDCLAAFEFTEGWEDRLSQIVWPSDFNPMQGLPMPEPEPKPELDPETDGEEEVGLDLEPEEVPKEEQD